MVIRLAVKRDLHQLVDLWVELMEFHQDYHPFFELAPGARRKARHELACRMIDPNTRIFVCDIDRGELAGMIITRHYGSSSYNTYRRCGYIAETVVRGKYRRRGIGRRLAKTACDWLTAIGADHLELQVVPVNEAAVRFWEQLGFSGVTRQMVRILI